MCIVFSVLERELIIEVELFLIFVNDVMDVICEFGVFDCKGSCVNCFVVKYLRVVGYDVVECKFKWYCFG